MRFAMTLNEFIHQQQGRIERLETSSHGAALTRRLLAMGLVPDMVVTLIRKAPLGGPLHVRVGSTTEIALRRAEAACIRVIPL